MSWTVLSSRPGLRKNCTFCSANFVNGIAKFVASGTPGSNISFVETACQISITPVGAGVFSLAFDPTCFTYSQAGVPVMIKSGASIRWNGADSDIDMEITSDTITLQDLSTLGGKFLCEFGDLSIACTVGNTGAIQLQVGYQQQLAVFPGFVTAPGVFCVGCPGDEAHPPAHTNAGDATIQGNLYVNNSILQGANQVVDTVTVAGTGLAAVRTGGTVALTGSALVSLFGTANEIVITCNMTTGNCTASIPAPFVAPGDIQSTGIIKQQGVQVVDTVTVAGTGLAAVRTGGTVALTGSALTGLTGTANQIAITTPSPGVRNAAWDPAGILYQSNANTDVDILVGNGVEIHAHDHAFGTAAGPVILISDIFTGGSLFEFTMYAFGASPLLVPAISLSTNGTIYIGWTNAAGTQEVTLIVVSGGTVLTATGGATAAACVGASSLGATGCTHTANGAVSGQDLYQKDIHVVDTLTFAGTGLSGVKTAGTYALTGSAITNVAGTTHPFTFSCSSGICTGSFDTTNGVVLPPQTQLPVAPTQASTAATVTATGTGLCTGGGSPSATVIGGGPMYVLTVNTGSGTCVAGSLIATITPPTGCPVGQQFSRHSTLHRRTKSRGCESDLL